MKNSILILIFIGVSFTGISQEKNGWTLQECVQYALEHNISIKQSNLDMELAEIEKKSAIASYFPTVNGRLSNSWNTGLTQNITTGVLENQTTRNFSAGVSVGVTIFSGLRNLRQLQRAKMARVAAQYSLKQMKDDIALLIANAYLQVLVNRETLKALQEQHQLTLQQVERTKKLVDAGTAPKGDLLQIKAVRADEVQKIIEAKNAIKISLINLAQMLLIQDYENFEIAHRDYEVPISTMLDKPVEVIIAEAKEERYEVKIAKANVKLAKKDVQLSKSNYYPTLSGFFSYNTRTSGRERTVSTGIDPNNPTRVIGEVAATGQSVVAPNFGYKTVGSLPFFDQVYLNDGISYGLSLNIPILNGLSTRYSVERRKIAVLRAQYELKQAKLDLESNVYQAYVDAQGAAKAYKAAKVSLKAQKLAFDYAQQRYDVGLANAFELSQTKLELTQAKSKLIQAKYDYIFKLKVLELYFGVPIHSIEL